MSASARELALVIRYGRDADYAGVTIFDTAAKLAPLERQLREALDLRRAWLAGSPYADDDDWEEAYERGGSDSELSLEGYEIELDYVASYGIYKPMTLTQTGVKL